MTLSEVKGLPGVLAAEELGPWQLAIWVKARGSAAYIRSRLPVGIGTQFYSVRHNSPTELVAMFCTETDEGTLAFKSK